MLQNNRAFAYLCHDDCAKDNEDSKHGQDATTTTKTTVGTDTLTKTPICTDQITSILNVPFFSNFAMAMLLMIRDQLCS